MRQMDQAAVEAIRRECESLVIAYARAIDFRDYDAFVELFTEDATLHAGSKLEGKADIRESIRHRPDELRSRHVISNLYIDVQDADNARGICYLTLYRHHGVESLKFEPVPLTGPAAIGHYEDRYLRTGGAWLFTSRRLQMAFQDPASF